MPAAGVNYMGGSRSIHNRTSVKRQQSEYFAQHAQNRRMNSSITTPLAERSKNRHGFERTREPEFDFTFARVNSKKDDARSADQEVVHATKETHGNPTRRDTKRIRASCPNLSAASQYNPALTTNADLRRELINRSDWAETDTLAIQSSQNVASPAASSIASSTQSQQQPRSNKSTVCEDAVCEDAEDVFNGTVPNSCPTASPPYLALSSSAERDQLDSLLNHDQENAEDDDILEFSSSAYESAASDPLPTQHRFPAASIAAGDLSVLDIPSIVDGGVLTPSTVFSSPITNPSRLPISPQEDDDVASIHSFDTIPSRRHRHRFHVLSKITSLDQERSPSPAITIAPASASHAYFLPIARALGLEISEATFLSHRTAAGCAMPNQDQSKRSQSVFVDQSVQLDTDGMNDVSGDRARLECQELQTHKTERSIEQRRSQDIIEVAESIESSTTAIQATDDASEVKREENPISRRKSTAAALFSDDDMTGVDDD